MIPWKAFIALIMLALCTTACASKKVPPQPLIMSVLIQPAADANDGRVFWMVVREVDEKQLSTDSYAAIEAIVLADERTPDVLGVCAVVPGQKHRIILNKPSYRPAAFYFLFTEPQEYWRVLLKPPIATKHKLEIGKYKASIGPLGSTW